MMGYDFDRQRPMGQFIVDLYCKALTLAIEIDGFSHDSPEAQARDDIPTWVTICSEEPGCTCYKPPLLEVPKGTLTEYVYRHLS